MARTIYSARLWSGSIPAGGGSVFGPSAPDGFVWDIRDVVAINLSVPDATLVPAFSITVNAAFTVFKTPASFTLAGDVYHLEGRQVVYPSDELVATSEAGGWSWSMTGYQLTA